MNRPLRVFTIVASAYVAAQMLADIASLRIISVAGFAVDAGTIVYPFTFTLRDLVHKIAGKRAARTLIFAAAAINLAMAGLFWLVSVLPADLATGPQTTFGDVLAPVWRIVFASIIAEVLSELIDGEVYQRWVDRFGRRHQWGRVLASNAVAIPIDSAVFVSIAFLGVLAAPVVWEVFWVNVAVKGIVTLISIPWIYLVRPAQLDDARPGAGVRTPS
jgi:uncharacterized integral membrane protein (TIGR00697 family)